MKPNRIHWIDIAKGILIILVVYGHLDHIAKTQCGTDVYNWKGLTNFLFLPYYMPAFFILTGMCSNFQCPVGKFLAKNFLTLIVPNILIGVLMTKWIRLFLNDGLIITNFLDIDYFKLMFTTGGWFLPALFLAKCMLYGLLRISRSKYSIMAITMILMLIGMFLYNRHVINPWYIQHSMIAIPFLFTGFLLKEYYKILDNALIPIIVGGVVVIAYFIDYPYFNAVPHVNWRNSIYFLGMSIFGSFSIFWFCRKLDSNKMMELLGRHSLTIFLLHSPIMATFISFSKYLGIEKLSMCWSIISGLTITILSVFTCLVVDVFLDKHFGIVKGKYKKYQ